MAESCTAVIICDIDEQNQDENNVYQFVEIYVVKRASYNAFKPKSETLKLYVAAFIVGYISMQIT